MSYFARNASQLAAHGFHPLPAQGKAVKVDDWARYCKEPPTPAQLATWAAIPDANCSLACGRIVALDVDVMDLQLARRIDAWIVEHIGDAPKRTGKAPKFARVFRADGDVASSSRKSADKKHGIDILAHGRQIVGYGIHPDTYKEYQWSGAHPMLAPISSLPPITQAQADAFFEEALSILNAEVPAADIPRPAFPTKMLDARAILSGRQRPTLDIQPANREAVEFILERLPNAGSFCYDDWITIGFAVYIASAGADWGFDAWRIFSARHSDYDAEATSKKWPTFGRMPRGTVGMGTLVNLARHHGIVIPEHIRFTESLGPLAGMALPNVVVPIEAVFAPKTLATYKDLEINVAPAECPRLHDEAFALPSGLMRELCDYHMSTGHSAAREFGLIAAIGFIATVAGRAFHTASDLRANVYMIALADSGKGKGQIDTTITQAMRALDGDGGLSAYDNYVMADKVYSSTALREPLGRAIGSPDEPGDGTSASKMILSGEVSAVFGNMNDKGATTRSRTLSKDFMELYSKSNGTLAGTALAGKKPITLVCPTLTLIGTSNPRSLFETMRPSDLDGGLANRLLCITAPPPPAKDYNERRKVHAGQASTKMPARVKSHICALMDYIKIHCKGLNPERVDYAKLCQSDDDAIDFATSIDMLQEQAELLAAQLGVHGGIFLRMAENTTKLALHSAIGRMTAGLDVSGSVDVPGIPTLLAHRLADVAAPRITLADMKWAWNIVRCATETLVVCGRNHVASNEYHAEQQRLLAALEIAGADGLSRSQVLKLLRGNKSHDVNPMLGQLLEIGDILQCIRPSRTKGATVYVNGRFRSELAAANLILDPSVHGTAVATAEVVAHPGLQAAAGLVGLSPVPG